MVIESTIVLQKTFTSINFRLVEQKNSKNDKNTKKHNILGPKTKMTI